SARVIWRPFSISLVSSTVRGFLIAMACRLPLPCMATAALILSRAAAVSAPVPANVAAATSIQQTDGGRHTGSKRVLDWLSDAVMVSSVVVGQASLGVEGT